MELENQVVSLELAKRLKELGVKQESLFYLYEDGRMTFEGEPFPRIRFKDDKWKRWARPDKHYSAFTVAELGQFLSKEENIVTMLFENGRCQMVIQEGARYQFGDVLVGRWGAAGQAIWGDTEADARAKMLIYLLENKLITL